MPSSTHVSDQLRRMFPHSPKADELASALMADEARTRDADNASNAAAYRELEAELSAVVQTREPHRLRELAEIERLRDLVRPAEALHGHQEARYRDQYGDLERRRDHIGRTLRDMAPASIGVFQRELRAEIAGIGSQHARVMEHAPGYRGYYNARTVWNNWDSIEARVHALRTLDREASLWHIEGLDEAALERRFTERRAALPAIAQRPAGHEDAGDTDAA